MGESAVTERCDHGGESGSRERRLGGCADVRHGDAELAPDEDRRLRNGRF